MEEKNTEKSARMFFALWPGGRTRGALTQAADKLHRCCGGKRTRAETLHLTLVFLGAVPLSRIGNLLEAAGKVHVPAFAMKLTKLGWWRHNRIAWAMPETVPEELAELVGQLRAQLASVGLAFDAKPYVPHVTLLRKGHCPDEAFPPLAVEWRAREFVLVRSKPSAAGAAYEIVGRWALSGIALK
ncbi:MAG: RNA 2',3'-cyclic phosphodiesterase [Sulfuricellaceae bacterium]